MLLTTSYFLYLGFCPLVRYCNYQQTIPSVIAINDISHKLVELFHIISFANCCFNFFLKPIQKQKKRSQSCQSWNLRLGHQRTGHGKHSHETMTLSLNSFLVILCLFSWNHQPDFYLGELVVYNSS